MTLLNIETALEILEKYESGLKTEIALRYNTDLKQLIPSLIGENKRFTKFWKDLKDNNEKKEKAIIFFFNLLRNRKNNDAFVKMFLDRWDNGDVVRNLFLLPEHFVLGQDVNSQDFLLSIKSSYTPLCYDKQRSLKPVS
uniref:Uncharacterized protein n=1 Tax=Homalodisca liturata TaxID=320908 RepID=A0A1B6HY48_9HEMI